MRTLLHLGIVQMPISPTTMDNVRYLQDKAGLLCRDPRRPHLIVGVEFGIAPRTVEEPDGEAMQALGKLAEQLGVWLVPGSLKLAGPKQGFLNAAPVFAPDGTLHATYSKMVPWDTDLECGTVPGRDYVVFDLGEPDTRVGLQICFDADFPEISRTMTLMGAEVLVQLSMDPDTIPEAYRAIKYARALENQAYYVYMNGVGDYGHYHLPGGSMVIGPEGETVYRAGEVPTAGIVTLDLDRLRACRREGSWNQVAQLRAMHEHAPAQPLAGKERQSPLFSRPPFGTTDEEGQG